MTKPESLSAETTNGTGGKGPTTSSAAKRAATKRPRRVQQAPATEDDAAGTWQQVPTTQDLLQRRKAKKAFAIGDIDTALWIDEEHWPAKRLQIVAGQRAPHNAAKHARRDARRSRTPSPQSAPAAAAREKSRSARFKSSVMKTKAWANATNVGSMLAEPLPSITKEEAARPDTEPHSAPAAESNRKAAESAARRSYTEVSTTPENGDGGAVRPKRTRPATDSRALLHDDPGTSLVNGLESRRIEVEMTDYEISNVRYASFMSKGRGFAHVVKTGLAMVHGSKIVRLPHGMVYEVASFWIGRKSTPEEYAVVQAWVTHLTSRVAFKSAEDEANARLYLPYVGWQASAQQRADLEKIIEGSVIGTRAIKAAKTAVFAALASALPTTATIGFIHGAAIALIPLLGVPIAGISIAAMIIKAALCGYIRDKHHAKPHESISAVTSDCPDAKQHPDAKITLVAPSRPARHEYRLGCITTFAVQERLPTIFARNQANTHKALLKRSCGVPPEFKREDRDAFLDWCDANHNELVGRPFDLRVPKDIGRGSEYDKYVMRWIEGCNSSEQVKRRYREAHFKLMEAGITAHSHLTPDQLYAWTKRDASVKIETVLKPRNKSPRQILAATPEFIVLTAPFVSSYTGVVRGAWTGNQPKLKLVYGPGVSEARCAALVDADYANRSNSDFDGYDSAQDASMGAREVSWFARYGAGFATIDLLTANLKTHGSSRQGVKFSGPYVRNSGDPHTTVCNTQWNVFAKVYALTNAGEESVASLDALLLAGGDDGSEHYNGPRKDIASILGRIGLPATVRHVNHKYEVEFLSSRWTRASKRPCFVPLPGKMMAKLAYSVKATPETAVGIARGAALSMRSIAEACPPLKLYCDAILSRSRGKRSIRPRSEPWKMTTNAYAGTDTADTWAHLGAIYGYTPQMHLALKLELDRAPSLGVVIDAPVMAYLMDVDDPRSSLPRMPDIDDSLLTSTSKFFHICKGAKGPSQSCCLHRGLETLDSPCCPCGSIKDVPRAERDAEQVARWLNPGEVDSRACPDDEKMCGMAPLTCPSEILDRDMSEPRTSLIGGVVTNSHPDLEPHILSRMGHYAVRLPAGPGAPKRPIAIDFAGRVSVERVVAEAFNHHTKAELLVMPDLDYEVDGKLVSATSQAPENSVINVRPKLRGGAGRVAQAERIMERLLAKEGVLESSRGAIMVSLDPFHDLSYAVPGWPDTKSANSVVNTVQVSGTISCPSSITSGTWDCHFAALNLLNSTPLNLATMATGGLNGIFQNTPVTTTAANVGGVTVFTGPTGSTMSMLNNVNTSFPVPQPYLINGPVRCIGYAFEVHNTTATNYKQGTVITYRLPTPTLSDASTYNIFKPSAAGQAGTAGSGSFIMQNACPGNPAEAYNVRGAQQWEATDGAYVVSTMNTDNLPTQSSYFVNPLFYEQTESDGNMVTVPFTIDGFSGVGSTMATSVPASFMGAFNQSGAFFSGLSLQSTLTVNVKYVLETFPAGTATVLMTLASPSPPYDPRAVELISSIMHDLPPGVMVKENGLGDWFSGVVNKIADFVSPVTNVIKGIAGAIPHPAAQAVARVAETVEGVSSNFVTPAASRYMSQASTSASMQSHSSSPPAAVSLAQASRTLSGNRQKSKNRKKKGPSTALVVVPAQPQGKAKFRQKRIQ